MIQLIYKKNDTVFDYETIISCFYEILLSNYLSILNITAPKGGSVISAEYSL